MSSHSSFRLLTERVEGLRSSTVTCRKKTTQPSFQGGANRGHFSRRFCSSSTPATTPAATPIACTSTSPLARCINSFVRLCRTKLTGTVAAQATSTAAEKVTSVTTVIHSITRRRPSYETAQTPSHPSAQPPPRALLATLPTTLHCPSSSSDVPPRAAAACDPQGQRRTCL